MVHNMALRVVIPAYLLYVVYLYLDNLDVDLLVIGTRGHRGLCERMIGSQEHRIMQLAHCPVLVVK